MQERKNADRLIEQGVDALRAERAQSPNAQNIVQAVHRRTPKTQRRYVATAAAALALVAIAVVSFAPRESAAADLKAIEKALQQLPPRQEIHLVATQNGEYEVQMEILVDGELALLQEKDAADQEWKDERLTVVHDEFATVQNAPKPDWTTKTFALSQWLRNADPKSVKRSKVKISDLELVGKIERADVALVLDRVAFDVRLEPMRLAHVVFDVEPRTLRPINVQAQIAGQRDIKVELVYDVARIVQGSLLKPGLALYDIDKQRQEVIDGFTSPVATAQAGVENVQLHAAIVDHDGHLVFVFSDTDGLPVFFDRASVVDKAMQDTEAPTVDLMPASLQNGVLQRQLVPYKDRKVGIVAVRIKKDMVDTKTIDRVTLPVTRNGMDYSVTFHDVPVTKTGSVLQLLAPENVPFWTKKNEQGAPTKSGGE